MIPGSVREEEETFEDDLAVAVLVVVVVASTQRDLRRHRSLHRQDREHQLVLVEDDHRVPMIGTILGTGATHFCLKHIDFKTFNLKKKIIFKITSTEKAGSFVGWSTTSRRGSNLE